MDWKGFCGTGCLAACAPLLAKERVDENTLVTASNEDLVQMVGLTQQQAGALQLRVLLLRARDLALAIEKGDALEQRFGSLDALLLLFAAPDILKAALRNNVGLTFGDLSAVMRALEAAHPAAKAAPLRREPPPPPVVAHAAAAHNGGGGASPAHARAPGSKAKAAAEPEEEDDDDAAAASPAAKKSRPKKHPDAPKRSRSAYLWFLDRHRAEQAAIHRTPGDPSKPLQMIELTPILAKMWKEADAEEKEACEKLAAESKAEYLVALEKFYQAHPEARVSRKKEKAAAAA